MKTGFYETKVTFYFKGLNRKITEPDGKISFGDIVSLIRGDKINISDQLSELDLEEMTKEYRGLNSKEEQRKYKVEKFPFFIPSGIYTGRKVVDLLKYQNIIHLDVDGVVAVAAIIKLIFEKDKRFMLCFISPSGKGFKIFYLGNGNHRDHGKMYEEYANILEELIGMPGVVDRQCKDLARACLLCHDSNLTINPMFEQDENWWPEPIKLLPIKNQGKLVDNVKKQEQESDCKIEDDKFGDGVYEGKLIEAEAILDFLSKEGKSITEDYDQWYLVAYALNSTFNEEDGRRLYMSFCKLDGDKYNAKKSAEKWAYCKNNNKHKVGFATIVFFAQNQGYVSTKKKRYPVTSFSIHSDLPYCRVGTNWFKIYSSKNSEGFIEEKISAFKRIEVFADVTKDYFYGLLRLDEFTNLPAFDGSYQRVIGNQLNLSSPLNIVPRQGSVQNSIKMLERMFVGEGNLENNLLGDIFTIVLDYLCVLFQRPTQKLPALILVSKANGTGKTTFLNWLRVLLGTNMTIVGNDQIRSRFNSTYINSLVVGVDESFLERDKRIEKERIKQLITALESFSESKGIDATKIPSHVKFIFCSNDEERVIYVEKEETRWLIVTIPELRATNTDPDMKKKLIDEAPAFLYLLLNREIFHKKEDRLWFASKHLKTDAFNRLVKNTRPPKETLIRDVIVEAFGLAVDKEILKISSTELVRVVNRVARYNIEIRDVKAFMRDNNVEYLGATSPGRGCWPYTDEHGDLSIRSESGRCWLLNRSDWIEDDENPNDED